MAKETRQLILDVSEDLFNRQGYSSTSMRQIAGACGITTGNLCYYFNKKEDLLMAYHNRLSLDFIEQLPEELALKDPWCSYIAAEYCFLFRCANDPVIRKLYLDVINEPSLRRSYNDVHHDIFLKFLSAEVAGMEARHVFLTTVATSSVEFHMMEQFDENQNELTFDDAFSYAFEVRMMLLGIGPEQCLQKIKDGFQLGKELFRKSKV